MFCHISISFCNKLLLGLFRTLYEKHFITFSTFLCISPIPLYTANNIRMLQSDMEKIATKDTGKAFSEANKLL